MEIELRNYEVLLEKFIKEYLQNHEGYELCEEETKKKSRRLKWEFKNPEKKIFQVEFRYRKKQDMDNFIIRWRNKIKRERWTLVWDSKNPDDLDKDEIVKGIKKALGAIVGSIES